MAKTLSTLAKGKIPQTPEDIERLLVRISKWKTLKRIRKKGTPAVFTTHVGGELIEGWQIGESEEDWNDWKDGGWLYFLDHYAEFFPYVYDALIELGLHELGREFARICALLPEIEVFDEIDFYCAIDFLKDSNSEVEDERLLHYSQTQRLHMSGEFSKIIERLDALSKPLWGETTFMEGWDCLIRYVGRNFDA